MDEMTMIFLIGVPLGLAIGGLLLWLQNRKKKKTDPPPEPESAEGPLFYRLTTVSPSPGTRLMKADLTQEEWRKYRSETLSVKMRSVFVSILLGLALFAVALFGNTEGFWQWMIMSLATGLIIIAFIPVKTGLTKEGAIVDRARLDAVITEKLKALNTGASVTPVKNAPDSAPEEACEDIPRSVFFPEEKPLRFGKLLLTALVILALDGLYFLLWRNNVVGGFAGFLGIAACVLCALSLIAWAVCRRKSSRALALIVCACIAVAGGIKVYTDFFLVPEAIRAINGESGIPDTFGQQPGLVIVRNEPLDHQRFMQLPLGNPLSFQFYASAQDRLADTAGYGYGDHATVSGYAYNCNVKVRDQAAGETVGEFTIMKSLPDKIPGGGGTYTVSATDGEIKVKVNECINGYRSK